jgi:hypothetical protein
MVLLQLLFTGRRAPRCRTQSQPLSTQTALLCSHKSCVRCVHCACPRSTVESKGEAVFGSYDKDRDCMYVTADVQSLSRSAILASSTPWLHAVMSTLLGLCCT